MKVTERFLLSLFITFIMISFSADAFAETPSEMIDNFYTARKFMRGTMLEIMASKGLSTAGRKTASEILYDYTVVETAEEQGSAAYAEVDVKFRSVEEGLRDRTEFWKLTRQDGRWIIDNVYIPLDWQLRRAVRPGSSLKEKVEAVAAFRYQYTVEDVPPGPPLVKCAAYIRRMDIGRAYYWADAAVRQTGSAEAYFYRGILGAALGRSSAGMRDLMTAIRKDRRYYYVLMQLVNSSKGGGGSRGGFSPESTTRIIQGGVGSLF